MLKPLRTAFFMIMIYAVVVVAVVFGVYAWRTGKADRSGELEGSGVKRVELRGGAVLLLQPVPGSRVASLRCLIKTGSATEGRWMGTGISHLVEHMLFKGTDRYGMAEISTVLRDLGGQHNAYTSFDRTVFLVTVPGVHSGPAMSVLANAVLHSSFPPAELVKEKEVVYNEILMNRDRVDRFFWDFIFRSVYDVHPYRHPVIGYPDLMRGLTREDVVAYHREKFRPSNLVFAVAGLFDEEAVIRAVEAELERFREIPAPPTVVEAEPARLSGRVREARRADAELTRLALVWPGVEFRHADMVTLDLLSLMLGQGKPSLLYRTVKERKGLVQEVSAFSYTPVHPGLIGVRAVFGDEKFGPVTNEIFRVLRSAGRSFSSRDLTRAKNMLIADRVTGLQTVDGITSGLLDGEALAGDPDFGSAYVEAVRRITLHDIRKAMEKYFRRELCSVVSVRPDLADQQPERVASATNAPLRIERKVLRSGLRIVYVHKPELPLVNLKFLVKGGLLLDEKPGLNRFVNDALAGGNRKYPGLKGFERIEQAGGSLSFFAGNNSSGATAAVLSEHLPLAADILYQTLRHPLFPKAKVGQVRQDLLAEARSRREDLFQEGLDLLRALFYTNHPYRYPASGTLASLSNISRADLKRFHRAYYTAGESALIVTGRVTERDKRIIERLFSRLPRGRKTREAELENGRNLSVPAELRAETEKARSLLLMAWPLPPLTDGSRWDIEVMNSVLSGLGGRLFVRLRDVEHLGYSVGGFPQFFLGQGMYIFYVTTTADRLEQAERSLLREIRALTRTAPTVAETEGSRSDLLGERMMREQALDSIGLEVGLAELFYGRAEEYLEWDSRISSVGPQDILGTARRLFGENARIVSLRGSQ